MSQTFRAIEAIRAVLTAEERAAFQRALDGQGPAELVAAGLWDLGFTISPSTIRTWRRMRRRDGAGARPETAPGR